MADTKQSSQPQQEGPSGPGGSDGYDGYDGREPSWVPHLIKALEGLRTNVRELTDAQKAIIVEHTFLKQRLAGPLLAPPGPVVSSFDPPSGLPGTWVTVKGKGFATALAVHFAGTRSSVQTTNDTTLTTKVPANAVTGPLTVFTADGAGTSRDSFTVTDPSLAHPQPQAKASARSGG